MPASSRPGVIGQLIVWLLVLLVNSASGEIYFSPGVECTNAILSSIQKTGPGQTILIEDYNFTHPKVLSALQEAIGRRVRVVAVLDRGANLTNKRSIAAALEAAGGEVLYDGKHPIAHIKAFLFPERQEVWFGSFNATLNAEKNHECWAKAAPEDVKPLIDDFWKHYSHSEKR